MTGDTPTATLPPCPVCSTDIALERPGWQFARNSSRATNRNCYFWTGCRHAKETIDPLKLRSDPDDWNACEDLWATRAAALFDAVTERWTEPQRERFRRTLNNRFFLPGAIDELPLAPAPEVAPPAAEPRGRTVRDPSSGEVTEQ